MSDVDRRSALKWIAGAPFAVAFGLTRAEALSAQEHAAEALREAAAGQVYQQVFFTSREWQTVRVLVDLILPADERSGSATDAGVPEFMDFLMTDPVEEDRAREERQVAMRGGLAWIDAECRRRFGHDFAASTEAQHEELLDDVAYSTGEEDEEDEDGPLDRRAVPLRHGPAFFNSFRDLTAAGFWSSKTGVKDLGYVGNTAEYWTGPPPEILRRLGLEPAG